jgi:exodeoxyribonuclease V
MMQLSKDQEQAYDSIVKFIESRCVVKNYFTVFGLAGTGKTALLTEIIKNYPGLTLTAFTGKAASVLRARVNIPVSTLHSTIYDFRGLADDEFEPKKKNPIFTPKGEPLPGRIVLVDESSMLGTKITNDLLDTGARVIAAGDPGQLPPVKDTQFFTEPDTTLTTIHRQALESPIIRQAHAVRHGGEYAADGDGFRVVSFADQDELLGHDIILCWRNRTRMKLNHHKRALLGHEGPLLVPGEPVMCLKNDHRIGVYNGAVYTVIEHLGKALVVGDGTRSVAIDPATIEGFDPRFDEDRYDDDHIPFALAYASTVHKSQGSEYNSVLIFDECTSTDRRALTYTGITRAVDRCTMVRWRS